MVRFGLNSHSKRRNRPRTKWPSIVAPSSVRRSSMSFAPAAYSGDFNARRSAIAPMPVKPMSRMSMRSTRVKSKPSPAATPDYRATLERVEPLAMRLVSISSRGRRRGPGFGDEVTPCCEETTPVDARMRHPARVCRQSATAPRQGGGARASWGCVPATLMAPRRVRRESSCTTQELSYSSFWRDERNRPPAP